MLNLMVLNLTLLKPFLKILICYTIEATIQIRVILKVKNKHYYHSDSSDGKSSNLNYI